MNADLKHVQARPHPLRFPGMDGFRALAALAIVAFHTYLATAWSTVGSTDDAAWISGMPPFVDGAFRNLTLRTNVFFVLSGLLLALPFVRWALVPSQRRPGLRRFAMRRVRRIWPLYLVIMPLAAATVSINRTSVEQVVGNALLVQNVAPGGTYLLPQTWTLTVEIGFYVLLPLVLVAVAPLARRLPTLSMRVSLLALVPLAWFAVGLALRASGATLPGDVQPRLTALGHLDNFAAGLLAALLIVAALDGRGWVATRVRTIPSLAWTLSGTALVTLGLLGRWHGMVDGARTGTTDAWWWVTPVALGVAAWMIAVALRPDRSLLARVVAAPMLVGLGQLSYGIFLWHYVVLHWFGVAGVTRAGGIEAVAVNVVLVCALTIPLSWVTWHMVEAPILDGRVRLPRPALPANLFRLAAPSQRPSPTSFTVDSSVRIPAPTATATREPASLA